LSSGFDTNDQHILDGFYIILSLKDNLDSGVLANEQKLTETALKTLTNGWTHLILISGTQQCCLINMK